MVVVVVMVVALARGRLMATPASHALGLATPCLLAFRPPSLPVVEPGLAIVWAGLVVAAQALVPAAPVLLLVGPVVLPGGVLLVAVVGACCPPRSGAAGGCGRVSRGTRASRRSGLIAAALVGFAAVHRFRHRPSQLPIIEIFGAVVRRLC